jgi:hypothetical protein
MMWPDGLTPAAARVALIVATARAECDAFARDDELRAALACLDADIAALATLADAARAVLDA